MKNLGQLLKQAQELQNKMAEMQAASRRDEISGESGGGMVTVTLNGKGEMRHVKIDPSLVNPDEVEMLEDLIVAAYNDAKAKVDAYVQDEMAKLTGGLQLAARLQAAVLGPTGQHPLTRLRGRSRFGAAKALLPAKLTPFAKPSSPSPP